MYFNATSKNRSADLFLFFKVLNEKMGRKCCDLHCSRPEGRGFGEAPLLFLLLENEPKKSSGWRGRGRGQGHPGRRPLKVNWLRAGSRDLVAEDGESTNPILAGRRSGGQKEEGDEAKRETANLQRRDHQQAPPHQPHPHPTTPQH